MIEIPEAIVLATQLEKTIKEKTINNVIVGASPHKFAFYHLNGEDYGKLLIGNKIMRSYPVAGRIEIELKDAYMSFNDGVNLRFYDENSELPIKHQLFISFDDGSSLVATVSMYGGLFAYPSGAMDENMYYTVSKDAVSPLSDTFSFEYFKSLFDDKSIKMSAKAFLATKQRIPGLGNGVLQDILLNARIHPKRKMNTLGNDEKMVLFDSIKSTLNEMVNLGGRDTEKDLYGNYGRYITKLSRNSLSLGCVNCKGEIRKEAYMGGSIYYCTNCQRL